MNVPVSIGTPPDAGTVGGAQPWRARVLLAGLALLLGVAWLLGEAWYDDDIPFLPGHPPAQWIVCAKPYDFDAHEATELRAVFRRSLTLDQVPTRATVRLRAFRLGVLRINGKSVAVPPSPSWKQERSVDIASTLVPGHNEIAIQVINRSGPPALWLALELGETCLTSDETWEAAYSGAAWRPARLATRPPPGTPGYPFKVAETAAHAWRAAWPAILLWLGLTAALMAGQLRWQRRVPAPCRPTATNPLRPLFWGTLALWAVLLLHNVVSLRPIFGFDASTHLAYIQYIMDRGALPLAHEGPSMYNPPLYYLLAALPLGLLFSSANEFAAVIALRVMSAGIGLLHLVVILRCLQLLFPGERRPQAVGFLVAAWLPMNLYLSHYPTNETLLALLSTTTCYLCLRILHEPKQPPAACAWLGACLGAALLTKFTAVLLLPGIFGALGWRVWRSGQRHLAAWLSTLGTTAGTCILVCGWHYARVWFHFGKPLVGAWDPIVGYAWWQDEGYRTSAWFWRCGQALTQPFFSAFHGFLDGIYSTLWADGLCGGAANLVYRPPWNYDLMFAGCWLSLGLSLWLVAGVGIALWRFLRQPSPEGLLLNSLAWLLALAFVHMALVVPSFSQVKAFYGLLALLPLGAFAALGAEWFGARSPVVRTVCHLLLGVWCLNNFATYWIRNDSADAHASRGIGLLADRQPAAASRHLVQALEEAPDHVVARLWLADAWLTLNRTGPALALMEQAVKEHPESAAYHLGLAAILEQQSQLDRAIEHTRRATALAPDHFKSWQELGARLQHSGRAAEAVRAYREALRTMPYRADVLTALAQLLATRAASECRTTDEALALAELACRMTRRPSTQALITRSIAEAQAGRYVDAIATAKQAAIQAGAVNDAEALPLINRLLQSYHARQPSSGDPPSPR